MTRIEEKKAPDVLFVVYEDDNDIILYVYVLKMILCNVYNIYV